MADRRPRNTSVITPSSGSPALQPRCDLCYISTLVSTLSASCNRRTPLRRRCCAHHTTDTASTRRDAMTQTTTANTLPTTNLRRLTRLTGAVLAAAGLLAGVAGFSVQPAAAAEDCTINAAEIALDGEETKVL